MRWLLSTRQVDAVTVVDVKAASIYLGETYQDLREFVKNLADEGKTNILLNLANVRIIDSTGIGDLIGCCTSLKNQSGSLKLLNPQLRVYDLLVRTRIVGIFEIFYDEREAIESFL